MTKTRIPALLSNLTALPFALVLGGLAGGCANVDEAGPDSAQQALTSGSAPAAGSGTAAAAGRRAGRHGRGGPEGCAPPPDGDGRGPHGKRHGQGGPGGPGHVFERWDADGDGRVGLSDLPEQLRERVTAADANGDGVVTRAEHQAFDDARRAEFLAEVDQDKDGQVSEAERAAMHERRRVERFAMDDTNSDGAIGQNEVEPAVWSRLERADTDADGQVTRAELDAAFAAGKMGPPHRGRGGLRGDGSGRHGGRRGPMGDAPTASSSQ
ncbi:MAG: hypothetical protein JW751_29245 [Polyangiaceae bacterium]|nr:hypothetical protein [Polyangiaceae bacterium]